MPHNAVIGLGFGDEGKGLVTNHLCLQFPNSLVVRYSGGQQAGHTVVHNGVRHVFSNFGSGTLAGCPTYWSEFCTFDPVSFYNELQVLKSKNCNPRLFYLNAKCPVTTPYEKFVNTNDKLNGTCGLGVGPTIKREEDYYSILVEDLFNQKILEIKLELLKNHYGISISEQDLDVFLFCCDFLRHAKFVTICDKLPHYNNIIFESSQGLLLDQHYGFFPHVTRSNVGTTNILKMTDWAECYLVTRAYQTRHGNGPMGNYQPVMNFTPNPNETNVYNEFQGEFKISLLDLDLLSYSALKDPFIKEYGQKLVITCLDQLKAPYELVYKSVVRTFDTELEFCEFIADSLQLSEILISRSEESKLINIG